MIKALMTHLTRSVFVTPVVAVLLSGINQAAAQRLSSNVLPSHYTLTLAPDLQAATYTGEETIDLTLAQPTKEITLNAIEIAFQFVTITAAGHEQMGGVSLDSDKQQATFIFRSPVPAGPARLSIHFTGVLNNELRGFYLSKTAKRNYAVSQLESTDARRAFPCFDEPAMKATFDISLIVDSGDTAISNGSMISDTPGPGAGKHTVKFSTTPKMSTYLAAFLVGDFECKAGRQDDVDIRVCATPDKVALTPYSLEVAKFALHYYNNYFGIPYPLKKLDLIAIPDFEAGAMENFGAITFRETAMLLDDKTASLNAKELVTVDITHEMAHQWFGDLVTMQWWDNVWLNEGFATWMENKASAVMHPEWNLSQSVASQEDGTINIDAQPTTRAIRAKADTPEEIDQMFDGIAYGKAGDVLLMIENYLGAETFRKGVHAYLAAHQFANATAEDFWNAQTAVSHKPVDKIMNSLVSQPGVPLLTFGEAVSGAVPVSQKRFFLSPSIQPDPAQKWTLPVCFKGSDGQKCEILTPDTTALRIPKNQFLFANAAGKGYYRSAYAPDEYKAIVAAAETGLTPEERINLSGDEWAQVRANNAPVDDYLDLAAALKADPDSQLLSSSISGIAAIQNRIASSKEERDALAAWVRRTFGPEYAKLGPAKPDDSLGKRELRADLFSLLGSQGHDAAILAEANAIAEKYMADQTSVDPSLGQTAASIAARNGDAALFDRLQQVYESSTNPELQEGALRLLALFKDPALVNRALDYDVSGKVRNQDEAIQFAIAMGNEESRAQTWKFVKENWDKILPQLTTAMGSYLVGGAGAFCTVEDRDDVKSFFTTHKAPATDVALHHAIEEIDGCIEFRQLQGPNLKKWLAAQPGM
jgi:aminopeptidase N/puromycin-sensitive aminopeptidase